MKKFFSYYKDKSLVNLSNSILKRFGCEPFHKTLDNFDEIFKNHKKIVLFLFDGFGQSISTKLLRKNSTLLKAKFDTISSTFPPTTAAATTSLKTGLYPAESGWLGWSFFDKENDRTLEYFTHKNYVTKTLVKEYDYDKFNYKTIFEIINEKNGKEIATVIESEHCSTAGSNKYKSDRDMMKKAQEFVNTHEEGFAYVYNLEPDTMLHVSRLRNPKLIRYGFKIERYITKFAKKNPDVLVLVMSDHSHIKIKAMPWVQQTELQECVRGCYSIDARCANFFVKEGKTQQFLDIFEKMYSKDHVLVSKQEAIENEIFGSTKDNKWLDELIGDYLMISVGESAFDIHKGKPMIHTHAGGTEKENLINVYVLNK